MSGFSTGVARDCLARAVGFDLECAGGAGRGLHAVLLLLVRVCLLSDLFHIWVVNFHQLFLCLLVDCSGDDEVVELTFGSELGNVSNSRECQHVVYICR